MFLGTLIPTKGPLVNTRAFKPLVLKESKNINSAWGKAVFSLWHTIPLEFSPLPANPLTCSPPEKECARSAATPNPGVVLQPPVAPFGCTQFLKFFTPCVLRGAP